MNVIKRCDLCDCQLLMEHEGRRLEFTAHSPEMCAAGVRVKIDALQRGIRSEVERAAYCQIEAQRAAIMTDAFRRALEEIVDELERSPGSVAAIASARDDARKLLDGRVDIFGDAFRKASAMVIEATRLGLDVDPTR